MDYVISLIFTIRILSFMMLNHTYTRRYNRPMVAKNRYGWTCYQRKSKIKKKLIVHLHLLYQFLTPVG
jgi:hypothetical protein